MTALLFLVLFVSIEPVNAATVTFDTGVLKVQAGAADGGFLDAVYLDRNGDGRYTDAEQIVARPPQQPAVVVAYTRSAAADGVTVGETVAGTVRVHAAAVQGLQLTIAGELDFAAAGTTPFTVTVTGRQHSAVLTVDWSFAPLTAPGLVLQEAALRVYGVFDPGEPGWRRQQMSTGPFRPTPRPEENYQFLTWQLGGRLVETPTYWREWSAWGADTGPLTLHDGPVPPALLSFAMHDGVHGIQAALQEPAAVAPVELAGHGAPAYLAIHAWTPRARGLPLTGQLPERWTLTGTALHFFATDLEQYAKGDKYWSQRRKILNESEAALRAVLQPARSNLHDPRYSTALWQAQLKALAQQPARGWEANIAATPVPQTTPVLPAHSHGRGWLALTVDAPAGTGGLLPLRGGIPFPRGALSDIRQLRVRDGQQRELPTEVEQLAQWPDGSVKWALVTVLADLKDQSTLRLEYGPGSRSARPPGPLSVQDTAGGVTVDTGALRFTLRRDGDGLFEDVRLHGQPLLQGAEATQQRLDLAVLPTAAGYGPYAFHAGQMALEPSRVQVDSIEIEHAGPLTAHIVVRGRYAYQTLGRDRKDYDNNGNPFWLRYTVYAGQSYVELAHFYIFEGNPDRELIQDLSLSLTPDLGGRLRLTTAADGQTTTLDLSSGRAGVYQDNPHTAELWTGPVGAEQLQATARAAAGWATLAGQQAAVTVGLREFRERYAKALTVENGTLSVELWPARARYLDTRRYARQYGDGESTSFGQGAAQGVARRHDLIVQFHAPDQPSAVPALLQPALLKASPVWYAASRAAGDFAPYSPAQYADWERLLRDGYDYLLYHRALWSWYGHYDYGDLQQKPDGNGGWSSRAGRWGWVNNEALVDLSFYEAFLRTGVRAYLDTALALSDHTLEVDLLNGADYKGNRQVTMHGHRHNVNHWGDGFIGIRIAAPQGMRLGYFLTGDRGIYDQLQRAMAAHWDSMHSYDKDHSTGLGLLTFFWEATGDEQYRQALAAYLDAQVAHYRRFGHLHADAWKFRRDQGRLPAEKPWSDAPTSFFFQNFGAAYSLMELAELTGRADLTEALIAFARTTIKARASSWEAAYCHYRLMAFAYRHSGDPLFRDYAVSRADRLNISAPRERWAKASALERFDDKLSMLAWTGQGLPYLMQALAERADDPEVTLHAPKLVPLPDGQSRAAVAVDGQASQAKQGRITAYEWRLDEQVLSSRAKDTLTLPPGTHHLVLAVTDSAGRTALAEQRVTVWQPGTVTQLCFWNEPDGFIKADEYSPAVGYGTTLDTKISHTSEPRYQGGHGCREVYITGGVRVQAAPGDYVIELGGKDYWTTRMGTVSAQGHPLPLKLTEDGSGKKLAWTYSGQVTVGSDGLLKLDFNPGPDGEPVVLAYVIVRRR